MRFKRLFSLLLIIGILCSLAISVSAGRPELQPPPERYRPPQREFAPERAPAVYLLDKEHDVVQTNSVLYQIHQKLKINSRTGVNRFLDYSIRYSRSTDKLTIHHAKVIQEDGTVFTPQGDEIVDVSISTRRMYSDARKRVIHWTGLEVGAVIDIKYTIESEFLIPGEYFSFFRFQDWMPIKKAEFSIEVPDDNMIYMDFKVSQSNGVEELPLEFTSSGNTYFWTLEKVPGIQPEMGMPSLSSVAPAIQITSLTDWSEVSNWWWKKVEPMVENLDQAIVEKAREVTQMGNTEKDKIMLLYHWIEQKLNYVALEFGEEGGYIPYHPNEVWKRGYGDCKDTAVLFVAMARALGLDSVYPALINTQGGVQPGTPTLWFNHAVAVFKMEEKKAGSRWLVLDTTTTTNKFGDMPIGDQNRWMLVMGFEGGDYELAQSALFPPEHNLWEKKRSIFVYEDGTIRGTVSWKLKGAYEAYFRYLVATLPKSQLLGFFQSYIGQLLPGARLAQSEDGRYQLQMGHPFRFVMQNPFTGELMKASYYKIEFSFVGKMALKKQDKLVFNVPDVDPLKGLIQKKWRYYPFIYNFPHRIVEQTSLVFPHNYKLAYYPKDWGVGGYWGIMAISYKDHKDLNSPFLKTIQRIVIQEFTHRWLPRRLYHGYVEATNQYALRIELPILLEKLE